MISGFEKFHPNSSQPVFPAMFSTIFLLLGRRYSAHPVYSTKKILFSSFFFLNKSSAGKNF